jgi:hypothetical protein
VLVKADEAFSFQNCAKLRVSVLLMLLVVVDVAVLMVELVLAVLVEACASAADTPIETPPPQLVRRQRDKKREKKN